MADTDDPLGLTSNDLIKGDFVVVLVGKRQKRCFVHESLLLKHASVPDTCYDGNKEIKLEDLDPDQFELYVHYLYTGKILCDDGPEGDTTDLDCALVEFYSLAERIGDQIAMHAAIRAFIKIIQRCRAIHAGTMPATDAIVLAHEKTAPSSPLCKLLVDMCIWDATADEDVVNEMPRDFANRVMMVALERLRAGEPHDKGADTATCCDYHELEYGQKCVGQKKKRKRSEMED